jgi:hypothetical protein
MHDTDRTLAELAALDQAAHEADLELHSEYEDENLENLADFEFEPEGDLEAFEGETGYEAQVELPPYEAESQFEGEGEGQYEGEGQFEGESQFEADGRYEAEGESTFGEVDQMEFAAELLEVQNEAELEYFLGGLLKAAVEKIGSALAGPVGGQLTGLLKKAAKTVVPIAGSAIGGMFGGPVGAALGGDIASTAGKLLGLELEGLAREDQEFEAAKAFVRFAADAAQDAATAPPSFDPIAAAHAAFENAAGRHAPGLLATPAFGPAFGSHHHHHQHHRRRMTGRWVRVARNQIVLHGI